MRLARQLFTENVLLCSIAGVGGWARAAVLVRAVPNIKGWYLPRIAEVRVDEKLALRRNLTKCKQARLSLTV